MRGNAFFYIATIMVFLLLFMRVRLQTRILNPSLPDGENCSKNVGVGRQEYILFMSAILPAYPHFV